MRRALFLLTLVLTGCAAPRVARPPVQMIAYQAVGTEPFWLLTIGDDRIVLDTDIAEEGEALWPRTLPRTVGNIRIWQSGGGTAVITVEARHEPCVGDSGEVYEDQVRVRLSGRELNGCGGRLVRERG